MKAKPRIYRCSQCYAEGHVRSACPLRPDARAEIAEAEVERLRNELACIERNTVDVWAKGCASRALMTTLRSASATPPEKP